MSTVSIKSSHDLPPVQTRPVPAFTFNPTLGRGCPICVLYADDGHTRAWLAHSAIRPRRYRWWLCVERDGVVVVDNVLLYESNCYIPTFDDNHGRSSGIARVCTAAAPHLQSSSFDVEQLRDLLTHQQQDVCTYPGPLRPKWRYVPVAERRAAASA